MHIFFRKPLFWPNFVFKNTNFAPPPENCAPKNLQNPYFHRLKKGGQVIDPTVAKLLTLLCPKCGQVIDPTAYIYIYVCVCILWSYYLGQVWPFWVLWSGPSGRFYLGQVCFSLFIVVSSDFLHTQLSFCVGFGEQLSGNLLKLAFFVCTILFVKFPF